jgi:hypothetical protein
MVVMDYLGLMDGLAFLSSLLDAKAIIQLWLDLGDILKQIQPPRRCH